MTPLKVVYINIEFDRHLPRVLSFLKQEAPDVVLFNELLELDVECFESALLASSFFVPQTKWKADRGESHIGQGVFSAYPFICDVDVYAERMNPYTGHAERHALVTARVRKAGVHFTLGLTHFPWTPDGEADSFQRASISRLIDTARAKGDLTLFGDFNAPRGREIFTGLTREWKDNIPKQYQTSLDENLHRVGKENFRKRKMHTYMVDGCFTTPGYRASDVRLELGIADHAAVVAHISKVAV